ncbi:MAG: beta-ketoacyl synthase N-terminal-like domain-containing protein, partial [Anaerolineales bacterium]
MERDAVIVTAVRTAVGKAKRGALATVRPDDLAAAVIRELVARAAPLAPQDIDDVILGCAMPEGEQGLNVARVASLKAGLPVSVPAQTVNRFCSSGLQTIADAAMAIRSGMADVVIAGGTESMSMVPMIGNKFAPNPGLAVAQPEVYMSMGLTAERVAAEYGVAREDQDRFALESHRRAVAALDQGAFADEVVPVNVELVVPGGDGPKPGSSLFAVDEG